MSIRPLRLGIVGATGTVGREILEILSERELPLEAPRLFASESSAGERIEWQNSELLVENLTGEGLKNLDLLFFSAGVEIAREYAPQAADAGAVVIDNSAAFADNPRVPLVVPEVNAERLREALRERTARGGILIATPSCATVQLVVVLKPILDRAGLKRVVVSTYQSVSGAGQRGIDEFSSQILALFNQGELKVSQFPHQMAFNCLPQVGAFDDEGHSSEENSIIQETRRILEINELPLAVTAIRVPTFACHGESVNIETRDALCAEEARDLLLRSPGIIVRDDLAKKDYPLNMAVAGTDATFVGRIRDDHSVANGLQLWIMADNVRKGSALNAVQIAEIVISAPMLQ